ncbi:membrane protein [Streptococcus phage Javan425]|uniref:Phage structural protein n=1 Tax=Streptococcus porcinus str. Jelinkova 176 TaxID=873448 RepID=A0ABN0CXD2_STRPO|nr:DUF859 family phage minor structural protein [Streptococcus porcinus]EGJ27941.1 hypothetical protein STRPO_0297 [Streptococcus porcinus str. Jelinkova 176]QBX18397.1 membrane protein [Streptococcus phage Javan423]QBX18414.1 membrane protein [Streptococcus phage Javan425]SQG44008.1 prophage LambdaSa03, minor structural protein [Streptococcus porcinus]
MATYYSNADRGYRLTYIVDELSTSTAKNSSQVRFRLYLTTGANSYAQYSFGGYAWVGSKYDFTAPSALGANSNYLLIDKTIEIPHDSNGNKTVVVAAKLNGPGGFAPSTLTISDKNFELTKIARASSVTSTSGYFGDTLAITINRSDASFTHDVRYEFEGLSGTVASNVATSATLATQLDWMTKIPNTKTASGKIIVDTKSGSTVIGTSETQFTLNVPVTIKPQIAGLTITDTNTKVPAIVGANNFIQIVSNPSVTFNGAIGAYGSTIETYTAKIVGKDQAVYSNGGAFGVLKWFGQATVEATVTDSRGQVSDPFRTTINVLEYKGTSIDFKTDRGAVNANQIVVTVTASVSPLLIGGVQKNKMILSFKTAPSGTQTFTIDTSSASTTYTSKYELISQQFVLSGTFDNAKSFDVYGTITDAFGIADSKKVPVSSQFKALTLMDAGSPAKSGVGINKKWEKGAVDAIGDAYITGKYYSNGKPVQQMQITQEDGTAIIFSGDINNLKTTGFYMAYRSATTNLPSAETGAHTWFHIIVQRHNDLWVKQTVTDFSGVIHSYRICSNGVWGAWIPIITANSPSQINTGWVNIGNSFYYKQVGDVVYLRYDFASNGVTRLSAGNMPTTLTPRAMMFDITGWTTAVDKQIQIQVNDNGLIEWLNPGAYKNNYRGQISWAI